VKKLAKALIAVSLLGNAVPLDQTLSFLTSEKKQMYSLSTGSNEDVFMTDTSQIQMTSRVVKKVRVVRKTQADGSVSEDTRETLTIVEGTAELTFIPQRPDFDLDVENISVTGEIADVLKVERTDAEDGIVFRIAHDRQEIEFDNRVEKGEIQITALGGFYTCTIPVTLVTTYRKSTDITELPADTPSQQPGAPDSSSPYPSQPAEPTGSPAPAPETPTPQTEG